VKEIDDALLHGDVDLAVHSAKDVPATLPDGIAIAAVPPAEDPRDALCGAPSLDALEAGARIGTASVRRRSQLLAARPDLSVRPLRGNVDTRLRKLADGECDAIVLALAGLRRLGREDAVGLVLDSSRFVPAAGQGALAVAAVAGGAAAEIVATLDHAASHARLDAERAVVSALDATCNTPVGASAVIDQDRVTIGAYVGMPDGSDWITDRVTGAASEPAATGTALGERLRAAGAGELLRRAEAIK
jgi:hydroxymethylbilane synthase